MRRDAAAVEQHERVAGAETAQTHRRDVTARVGTGGLIFTYRHSTRLRDTCEQLCRSRDAAGLDVLIGQKGHR